MPDLVCFGVAIEGDALSGHSRNPVKNLGLKVVAGQRVYAFKAEFNARASISSPFTGAQPFEPNAALDPEYCLVADGLMLYSEKSKYSSSVKPTTSTHKANHWHLPHHSSARILKAHKEMENAILKRL